MEPLYIKEYNYNLPDHKIAKFPLKDRDSSKLLVYKKGEVSHKRFKDLATSLPKNSTLVFNNTKVIPARLYFKKATGASIELFLLEPIEPSPIMSIAMETTQRCVWRCMIGNKKKWKGETLILEIGSITLNARLLNSENNFVEFFWNSSVPFAEIISSLGNLPLPPYLNREAEEDDLKTYQTVYSEEKGAVAAPTAGLHFTNEVLGDLKKNNIKTEFLTLHVGAGTFQPVKVEDANEHPMHAEQFEVSLSFIEQLAKEPNAIIPVGTTSMRTLESLYWYGVMAANGNFSGELSQEFAYENKGYLSKNEALMALANALKEKGQTKFYGSTSIFIKPGYTFRVCAGLVTNFHQPCSTLLLLVSALIGESWKSVYNVALENNYRFLSYGDSSLLMA